MICQAGVSPAGREFAAKYADTIVARCRGAEAAKGFRDDMRARMVGHGRKPDGCKVMFSVSGRARRDRWRRPGPGRQRADAALVDNMEPPGQLSFLSGVDFSKFPLDEPLGEVRPTPRAASTQLLTTAPARPRCARC